MAVPVPLTTWISFTSEPDTVEENGPSQWRARSNTRARPATFSRERCSKDDPPKQAWRYTQNPNSAEQPCSEPHDTMPAKGQKKVLIGDVDAEREGETAQTERREKQAEK